MIDHSSLIRGPRRLYITCIPLIQFLQYWSHINGIYFPKNGLILHTGFFFYKEFLKIVMYMIINIVKNALNSIKYNSKIRLLDTVFNTIKFIKKTY